MSRFLLISLSIDAILRETTIHRRREKVQVMTDGLRLEFAYGRTLDRIKAQDDQKSSVGMAALMWILLKYSRCFHISHTTATLDVWTRIVRVWKGLRNMGVEAIVVWTNGWLQRRCFGYTQETY